MSGDDGGPAFPNHPSATNYGHSGMSLRDYFAGQALAALCGREVSYEGIAYLCYMQADAMIAERSKASQAVSEAQQIALAIEVPK